MSRISLMEVARVEEEGDQGRISTVLRSMVDVSLLKDFKFMLRKHHRRRIKTEEKAKVVATSVYGKEFIQFLDALAVLR